MTVSAARVGAWLWVSAVLVLFVAHGFTEAAWSPSYSWLHNNISDLGNVRCGAWGDDRRYVCSPRHALMNVAFVVVGSLLLGGVVLRWRSLVAPWLFGLTAAGWIWVGLMPADVDEGLHLIAALPIFIGGNLGLLLNGRRSPAAAVAGALGLVATAMHLSGHYGGLGMGGTERIAGFALPLWCAVAGLGTLFADTWRRRCSNGSQTRPGR